MAVLYPGDDMGLGKTFQASFSSLPAIRSLAGNVKKAFRVITGHRVLVWRV
jgi:SNF2 family DNA or RNA helicase